MNFTVNLLVSAPEWMLILSMFLALGLGWCWIEFCDYLRERPARVREEGRFRITYRQVRLQFAGHPHED